MENRIIAVDYKVKPEHLQEFIEHLKENAKHSLTEPGCINYEASIDGCNVFLYERYKAKEDIDYHMSQTYYKNYAEKIKDLLENKIVRHFITI